MSWTHQPRFGASDRVTVRGSPVATGRWTVQVMGRPARLFSAGRADYLDKPISSPLFSLISHPTGDESEIGLDSLPASGPLKSLEDEKSSKEDEEES